MPGLWDRFWAKVQVQGECWIWQGAVNGKGYGQIRVGAPGKLRMAHRISYRWFKGVIPTWLELDHTCRNKPCVYYHHLEAVTASTNVSRGIGLGAGHAAKTHCPAGHPYVGANLYLYQRNESLERHCRTCRRDTEAKRRQRAKEMRTTAAPV